MSPLWPFNFTTSFAAPFPFPSFSLIRLWAKASILSSSFEYSSCSCWSSVLGGLEEASPSQWFRFLTSNQPSSAPKTKRPFPVGDRSEAVIPKAPGDFDDRTLRGSWRSVDGRIIWEWSLRAEYWGLEAIVEDEEGGSEIWRFSCGIKREKEGSSGQESDEPAMTRVWMIYVNRIVR